MDFLWDYSYEEFQTKSKRDLRYCQGYTCNSCFTRFTQVTKISGLVTSESADFWAVKPAQKIKMFKNDAYVYLKTKKREQNDSIRRNS